MKIIGLIAGNRNDAQDWIDNYFGGGGGQVSLVWNCVRWYGLEIRYLDNTTNAQGLELAAVIRLPGYQDKWEPEELTMLETRIRP